MTQQSIGGITAATNVELFPFTVTRHPGKDPILGRPEIKHFIEVGDETLIAVQAIQDHESIEAAEKAVEKITGELYDIHDLAVYLARRGFVKSMDGQDIRIPELEKKARVSLGHIESRKFTWMRHWFTLYLVFGLSMLGILMLLLGLAQFPQISNAALFIGPLEAMLLAFALMLANAILHELCHLGIARSYGVESRIFVKRRFHILLFHTDVSNAWMLPDPKQRAGIFASGPLFNLAMLSVSFVAIWSLETWIPTAYFSMALIELYAFTHVVPLLFQLLFWIRTDLYYLLLAATGERNLQQDSSAFIRFEGKRLLNRLRRKNGPRCNGCNARTILGDVVCYQCDRRLVMDPNELNVNWSRRWLLRSYGVIQLMGIPLMLGFFALYMGRIQERIFTLTTTTFQNALATGAVDSLIYAVLVLLISLLQLSLLGLALLPLLRWIGGTLDRVLAAVVQFVQNPLGYINIRFLVNDDP